MRGWVTFLIVEEACSLTRDKSTYLYTRSNRWKVYLLVRDMNSCIKPRQIEILGLVEFWLNDAICMSPFESGSEGPKVAWRMGRYCIVSPYVLAAIPCHTYLE